MSVPDLEKVKEDLMEIRQININIWEECGCERCENNRKTKSLVDQALAELERGEKKEVDYKDPKNWIAGWTVIQLQDNGGNKGLFMGGTKIYLFEEKEFFTTDSLGSYEFVCNLPDPTELK